MGTHPACTVRLQIDDTIGRAIGDAVGLNAEANQRHCTVRRRMESKSRDGTCAGYKIVETDWLCESGCVLIVIVG